MSTAGPFEIASDSGDTESLEDTGERCIPGTSSPIIFCEHIHRYLFASRFVSDLDVLDIGSGEGYGAALLARAARRVTGVDIDAKTIEHGASRYPAENLVFVLGSASDLSPCADDSADVVTCFETLEHISEHEGLMASIKRVLRPGGLLLLSSPDRDIYTTASGRQNPFHVLEVDLVELRDLLGRFFAHQVVYRQTTTVGSYMSLVGIDSDLADSTLDFVGSRGGDTWKRDPADEREYLFAIASDADLPPMPTASHLHDSDFEFRRMAEEWERQAQSRQQSTEEWQRQAADWQGQAADWQRQAEDWERRAEEWDRRSNYWERVAEETSGELDGLRTENDALRADFDGIRATRAFRTVERLWRIQEAVQATVAGRRKDRSNRPVSR